MREFKRRDINNAFREYHNQEESTQHSKGTSKFKLENDKPKITRGFDKIKKPVVKSIEEYKPVDLLTKFKFMMKDANIVLYSTSKLDARYLRNIKLLQDKHTNQEILDMLEFLVNSEQEYIDKSTLHPGILLTQWVTKIKSDTQEYLEGTYVYEKPVQKVYKKDYTQGREYSGNTNTESGSVGVWK